MLGVVDSNQHPIVNIQVAKPIAIGKVCVLGRSMQKNVEIADRLGYLDIFTMGVLESTTPSNLAVMTKIVFW